MTNRCGSIWFVAFLLLSVASAVQHFVDGDIDIFINGTYWKCDRIICPAGTFKCQVTVEPATKTELSRKSVCYAQSGAVLGQRADTMPMGPNEEKHLKVEAFENAITTSSRSSIYGSNYYTSGSSNSYAVSGSTGYYNNKQAGDIGRQVQQQVDTINTNLQQQMTQLQNMFSTGFFGRR